MLPYKMRSSISTLQPTSIQSVYKKRPIRENISIYIDHEFYTGGNVSLGNLEYEY